MPIKLKLIKSLSDRLESEISPQNTVKFLKDVSAEEIVNIATSVIYLYTRGSRNTKTKNILVAEVITAIGHAVRNKVGAKRDSAIAAKAGGFILYSFQELFLLHIKLGHGPNGHATYIVEVLDDDAIVKLWEGLPTEKIEKLPSLTPYVPWTSSRHATGLPMIKTSNKSVLELLQPDEHPIVFAVLNKAQAVGWQINSEVFPLVSWALRNRADAFSDIWEIHSNEARQSKIREATTITSIAKRFVGKVFYH